MSLAVNLRLQRKKAGLTQIALAEKLGVSIATMRRWESGETSPTGRTIVELASLLKISASDLVNDKPSPHDKPSSHNASSVGMLVYEEDGRRIELPPTEKGYTLFERLIEKLTCG